MAALGFGEYRGLGGQMPTRPRINGGDKVRHTRNKTKGTHWQG
jgi:hypothetical protein